MKRKSNVIRRLLDWLNEPQAQPEPLLPLDRWADLPPHHSPSQRA